MAAGKNRISIEDSPAFRKANHDAMDAVKKTVARLRLTLSGFVQHSIDRPTRAY
jgi:hypothetical protein